MFKDIVEFYKIGKDLGLSRRDINQIFLFGNTNHPTLYLVLMIIGIIGAILIGTFVIIAGIHISRNTYPTGARYSTIKGKDFKRKK